MDLHKRNKKYKTIKKKKTLTAASEYRIAHARSNYSRVKTTNNKKTKQKTKQNNEREIEKCSFC